MKYRKIIVIFIFLLGSCTSDNAENQVTRTFAVADFCKNDVINYFSQDQMKAIGVNFSFIEFDRKLMGTENIIGMFEVRGGRLNVKNLDSFINGAVKNCQPNARIDVDIDDNLVKELLSRTKGIAELGETVHGNKLLVLTKEKLMIYSKY